MEETDRRVRRTQKMLAEALMLISLEKGYDSVTIKDITDKADVSYSTFFRHYGDKDELLLTMLKDIVATLSELITPVASVSPEAGGTILFRHIQEQHQFYRVLFSSQGSSRVLWKIRESAALRIAEKLERTEAAVIPPEIAANHVVSATLSLIQWWLEHEMPYSAERMGQIYADLVMKPINNEVNR